MNATEIITSKPVNVWQIGPDGCGAYDFNYDGDKVVLLKKSQRAFLLTDEWCGGNVEGECYRCHFSEVGYSDAVEAVLSASRGKEPSLGGNGGSRYGNAPVWLKQAVKRADVRDALDDKELTAAIDEEQVGSEVLP